ncbi:MAG: SPOR domain-containing protein [Pseudomonadota bacterium]
MNEVLKQRLVGALILLALGVIFWPIIFVQPDVDVVSEQRAIPPGPAVAVEEVDAPDLVGLRESPQRQPLPEPDQEPIGDALGESTQEPKPQGQAEEVAESAELSAPSPAEQIGRTTPPEPLQVDSDGVPVAWILQVVSVSSEVKANELRAQLLAMDYKAYVKRVPRDGKTLYRVYIGPQFEKSALQKLQPVVDKELGVSSMITRYVP